MSAASGPPPPTTPPPGVPPSGPPAGPPGAAGVPPPYTHKTPWTAYIKPVIWTLVALYVILFVFLNRDAVTINFLFFKAQVALIFVLVGMTLIGAALCAGVMVMVRRRSARKAELEQARANPGKK